MRLVLIVAILVLIGSVQGEKSKSIPETGLIAYYSFNDGTARDDSGNGNDGQLKGGANIVPGRIGDAVSLDVSTVQLTFSTSSPSILEIK